ncbi:MAG: Rieske (2Fe-2S) protein [Candidatus Bathyarchaeota archaeon]|nr:Rieske (2Fe-2S) protein [Candidatus Bathyarchaeota archaeon]
MVETGGYVAVADEKDIGEGKMRLVRAKGIPVLIVRHDGELYVLDDRCHIWAASSPTETSTATSSFAPAMTGALT